jgi:hypothetical protein
MKHSLAVLAAACLMGQIPSVHADSILGPPGSGQPTNTVLGTASGAAIGAAIGQTGGKDGWWIGSLIGGLVGGALGNSIPTDGYGYAQPAGYGYSSVSVGYGHSRGRSHCGSRYHPGPYFSHQVIYSPPPVVVHEVVVEEPVVYTPPPPVAPVAAPYGHMGSDGTIKSPWSDFSMSVGGLSPGQIVYDGYNGKPFTIP